MKNNQGNNKNYSEIYQNFVHKITKITKNDYSNTDNQNRDTFGNTNFTNNKLEINMKQNNFRNEQTNNNKEQQRLMYEKMNQKLINQRRNVDWSQNQDYTNNGNNNGQKNLNRNEIDSYKVFNDKSGSLPFGGGKNAPIVQLLNQKNYEYAYKYKNGYQDQNLINHNNIHIQQSNNFDKKNNNFSQKNIQNMNDNNNYPFKINPQNNDNFNNNNNLQYSSKNNSITIIDVNNKLPKNIPENSKNSTNNKINLNQNNYNNINYINPNDGNINNNNSNEGENSNNSGKSNGIASSIFYGLLFGSFGTLLLWCKNPKVREYLKSCYQNINTESIINFFKSLLHPIDLFNSINIGSLKEILKESLNYLYQFIEDYSDLWRLLGVIVMVYAFWLIIKIIFRKFLKNENKKKKKKIKSSENIV